MAPKSKGLGYVPSTSLTLNLPFITSICVIFFDKKNKFPNKSPNIPNAKINEQSDKNIHPTISPSVNGLTPLRVMTI